MASQENVDIKVRLRVERLNRDLTKLEQRLAKIKQVDVKIRGAASAAIQTKKLQENVNKAFQGFKKLEAGIRSILAPIVLATGLFDKQLGSLNEELKVVSQLTKRLNLMADTVKALDGRLAGVSRAWSKITYDIDVYNALAKKQVELEDRRNEILRRQAEAIRRQRLEQTRLYENVKKNVRASEQAREGSGFRAFSQGAGGAVRRRVQADQAAEKAAIDAVDRLRETKATKSFQTAIRRQNYLNELKKKGINDADKAQRTADRKAERRASEAAKKQSKRLENLALGAGFPLLFGGGPGSIAGGVLGAVLQEDGFGLQVLLSALGQKLDELAQYAGGLGQALLKPTTNIDTLIDALGIANTGLESTISTLRELGYESVASGVAVAEFEAKYGEATADSIRMLGKEFTNMQNAVVALGVRLAAFISGPLGGFLKIIGDAAGSAGNAEAARLINNNLSTKDRKAFQKDLERLTGGAGFSGFISDAALTELTNKYDPATVEKIKEATKERQEAEALIARDLQTQVNLAKAAAAVEAGRLTNRRDSQAALSAGLAVDKARYEVSKIQENLNKETEKTKIRLLNLELNIAKASQAQAEAARQNAIIEAQRQIQRDVSQNLQAEAQAAQQLLGVEQQLSDLRSSEADSYAARLDTDQQVYEINKLLLEERRKMALLGVTEQEVRDAINLKFDMQNRLLERQNELLTEQRRQTEVLRMDKEREVLLQRELNDLLARQSAAQQIRNTDPQRRVDTSTAGMGFFGDSELFSQNRIADSAAQLEAYNEQIAGLQSRIAELTAKKVDPDRILPLKDALLDLQQTRDLFQQLQPGIDAAAISARRYADALKLVSPGINSLASGLQDFIRGTKTAEQVFADFLNTIAEQLISTAATMIAQYIAIGIARAFAMGGTSGGNMGGSGYYDAQTGLGTAGPNFGLADGGTAAAGSSYLVGERGPELFIPGQTGTVVPSEIFNATRAALAGKSSSSADAFAENGEALSVATSYTRERQIERDRQTLMGSAGAMTIETQVINNVEYATVEQVEKASMQSAKRARAQVFSDMRNKPSTRSSLGMR